MDLREIYTFAEASELWGLSESTLRRAQHSGRFKEGETKKSGGTWIVTRAAMERLYGGKMTRTKWEDVKMTKELRKILVDASSGKGDIWKETEVAARILLAGGYPGHNEDLECLEDIEDCIELENLLSRGSWYFQETDKWKEEA